MLYLKRISRFILNNAIAHMILFGLLLNIFLNPNFTPEFKSVPIFSIIVFFGGQAFFIGCIGDSIIKYTKFKRFHEDNEIEEYVTEHQREYRHLTYISWSITMAFLVKEYIFEFLL